MKNGQWLLVMMSAGLAFLTLLPGMAPVSAQHPTSCEYLYDANVKWFCMVGDVHMGEDMDGGTQDSRYLGWVVNNFYNDCQPIITVNAGDLTDGSDGWYWPGGGPYSSEWSQYRAVIDAPNINPNEYMDLPGNHDAYNDGSSLSYYMAYSVHGSATGFRESYVRKNYSFGSYLFLTAATTQNNNGGWPSDDSGLDAAELNFLDTTLAANTDCDLTFVFGHHPVSDLGYGASDFLSYLANYNVSLYGYGHTHSHSDFWQAETLHSNIASLGKSSSNHIGLFGIDGHGLSFRVMNVQQTPIVLITAPLNDNLGATNGNLYTYPVPKNCGQNPVRALAITDPVGQVSYVNFRIDGGSWQPMNLVAGYPNNLLWQGQFSGVELSYGQHLLEAIVVDQTKASNINSITFTIADTQCTDGVDNDSDSAIDMADCGCQDPLDNNESDCTNPTATPTIAPTSTRTPTLSPTRTATLTPTLTSSVTPTRSPTRTPTLTPSPTYTATPTNASCADLDVYEPNDAYTEAGPITVDGMPQHHYFCTVDDNDWASFTTTANYTYEIRTLNLTNCDTMLYLYNTNGTSLITSDDNSGGGNASLITYTFSTSNVFYTLVNDNGAATGSTVYYNLSVTAFSPTPIPTNSPTKTPTVTLTPTSTRTSTNTPTRTPTVTASGTLTPSLTPTLSPTRTQTRSPTNTVTLTPTGTVPPSNTPTQSPTYSPTQPPTFTPTPTDTVPPTPTPVPTQACVNDGDVNADNSVTAGDAQIAFSIALGMITPTFEQACAADCNGDGSVTAGDAQMIFFAALGSGTCVDPIPLSLGTRAQATNQKRTDAGTQTTDLVWLQDATGCRGDLIHIPVMVSIDQTAVDAFTVDIEYDTTILRFVSCSLGALNPGWIMFDGKEVAPGQVRALGFTVKNSIAQGTEGSLAVLTFEVLNPLSVEQDATPLRILSVFDSLENFKPTDGQFTYFCK